MQTPDPLWEINQQLTDASTLAIKCPDGWWEAFVRWDGCFNLHQAGNVPFSDEYGHSWGTCWNGKERDPVACDDYIHICDLDDYIKRLQTLRDEAVKYFIHWPGC